MIGFCTLTLLNSANATMQLESDPAFRGRVMALYMTIVMGGTPIGSPVIGWVGRAPSAPAGPCSLGGVLVIVGRRRGEHRAGPQQRTSSRGGRRSLHPAF